MPAFYEHALWIPQYFPVTNPDLPHKLVGGYGYIPRIGKPYLLSRVKI